MLILPSVILFLHPLRLKQTNYLELFALKSYICATMQDTLNFSNWSLKKTLNTVDDPITKAKITVFYYLFLLNFPKVGALFSGYVFYGDVTQVKRAIIGIAVTVIILKLLTWKPAYLQALIFFTITSTILGIWKVIVIDHTALNVVTIQNVFMIIMWSFYGLPRRWGYFYCILAIIPIVNAVSTGSNSELFVGVPQIPMFASSFIIVLNFLIILVAHFYYRNILYNTIAESKKLNEELEQANAANTLFFSSMSHELRTPLNAVIGMASLLIDDNRDKEQKENLDILKFSAESLLSLINDILDFSKMGMGSVSLEAIPFNLKELAENVCAGLRIKANEKNLYCTTDIDPEIAELELIGDPTRISQIIYNLVGNAIKFTKKGGVSFEIKLMHRVDNLISLRFMVKDTGLGISPEQQKLIFEPFTQADVNTTRNFGGTGLGLSIVKHLLTLHNTNIDIESELGAGAVFSFDITYAVSDKKKEEVVAFNFNNSARPVSDLKVLMAEDNAMNSLLMKKLFSKWNIQLDIAENGEEAVKLVEVNDYDIILMDLQMPVMNGYEATTKIRTMTVPGKATIPIIALTASVSSDVQASIIEVGMTDFVSKPFNPNELYEKLQLIQ